MLYCQKCTAQVSGLTAFDLSRPAACLRIKMNGSGLRPNGLRPFAACGLRMQEKNNLIKNVFPEGESIPGPLAQ